jgi:hypothetical protein
VHGLFNFKTNFAVQKLFNVIFFYQFFLSVAESFEFYLGKHCLFLLIPVYSLLFPALASKFHAFFKDLNPLCVDTCTAWQTWI